MKLRVLESQWRPFVDSLRARKDVETAGIILAERVSKTTLVARVLTTLADDAYAIRRRDRIQIHPVALNRLVRPARDQGLSVFTIHTHPGTDEPWFSFADDAGDSVLMPSILTQMPGPHGSLVVAGNTGVTCARAWNTPEEVLPVTLHEVGSCLCLGPGSEIGDNGTWHDRQLLALGDEGQRTLRRLHVAVVGLGGTGSMTFTQLVHLGVGQITVIDGDRIEDTNISRILGATVADAGVTFKVDAAARYAAGVGLGTVVHVIRGHLGRDVSPDVLTDCDVVFACVDAHLPRALLNRLSYEKAILLFDMGSAFRVSTGHPMEGAGRVVVCGPGRPCLACWGHIDPNRIRIESLPDDERRNQAAEGYISGADIPQPSVIAFNTLVAGAAVVEFLRAVTGFAGTDDSPLRLSFDFTTGIVRRNKLASTVGCRICQNTIADSNPND